MTKPEDMLRDALQGQRHVSDLEGAEFERAKAIEATFTGLVATLTSPLCPSPAIRELGAQLWDAIEGRHIKTAVFDGVQTLHFTVFRGDAGVEAVILIPPKWLEGTKADPVFCLGGVVYSGSQACSWRKLGRIDPAILDRAAAYEAEYLLTLRNPELF